MKPIKRIKRPTRRIKINGKWHGGPKVSETPDDERTKAAPATTRKAIITADGLRNEVAAAEYLGLAVSTLQNRRSRGEPPAYERHGSRIFYQLEALERFRNGSRE